MAFSLIKNSGELPAGQYQAMNSDIPLPNLGAAGAGSTCWVADGAYLAYYDGANWRYARNAPSGKTLGAVLS